MSKRLTKEQAAIVGAYTGLLAGSFSDLHKYINGLMGRPVFTHELANKKLVEEIQRRARPDFLAICHEAAAQPDAAIAAAPKGDRNG